jgi:hypothetical protein
MAIRLQTQIRSIDIEVRWYMEKTRKRCPCLYVVYFPRKRQVMRHFGMRIE